MHIEYLLGAKPAAGTGRDAQRRGRPGKAAGAERHGPLARRDHA